MYIRKHEFAIANYARYHRQLQSDLVKFNVQSEGQPEREARRGQLPAYLVDSGRQSRFERCQEQDRPGEPLGYSGAGAPWILEGSGRHCGQERAHVLGDAAARRCVQSARVRTVENEFVDATV